MIAALGGVSVARSMERESSFSKSVGVHAEHIKDFGKWVEACVESSRFDWLDSPPTFSFPASGGGGGIRTRGTFPFSGFQDRCNKPLYHPSYELMFGAERPALLPRNLRQFSGDKSNPCGLVQGPARSLDIR